MAFAEQAPSAGNEHDALSTQQAPPPSETVDMQKPDAACYRGFLERSGVWKYPGVASAFEEEASRPETDGRQEDILQRVCESVTSHRSWAKALMQTVLSFHAQETAEPLVLDGRTIKVRLLSGKGAFGEIWAGVRNGEPCVIKLMKRMQNGNGNTEFLHSRFRREAKILQKKRGDATPGVRELEEGAIHGEFNGRLYYIMEYCQGRDLGQVLARSAPDPLPADDIALLSAVAVMKLHEYRDEGGYEDPIVHRDIKPDNIHIGDDGQVRILDLGLSSEIVNAAQTDVTGDNALGTPHYMAPEQFYSSHTVGTPADIYGLGCMFYEMYAGSKPYTANNPVGLMHKHTGKDYPDFSVIENIGGPELAKFIRKMMHKDAGARPTAREVGQFFWDYGVQKKAGLSVTSGAKDFNAFANLSPEKRTLEFVHAFPHSTDEKYSLPSLISDEEFLRTLTQTMEGDRAVLERRLRTRSNIRKALLALGFLGGSAVATLAAVTGYQYWSGRRAGKTGDSMPVITTPGANTGNSYERIERVSIPMELQFDPQTDTLKRFALVTNENMPLVKYAANLAALQANDGKEIGQFVFFDLDELASLFNLKHKGELPSWWTEHRVKGRLGVLFHLPKAAGEANGSVSSVLSVNDIGFFFTGRDAQTVFYAARMANSEQQGDEAYYLKSGFRGLLGKRIRAAGGELDFYKNPEARALVQQLHGAIASHESVSNFPYYGWDKNWTEAANNQIAMWWAEIEKLEKQESESGAALTHQE